MMNSGRKETQYDEDNYQLSRLIYLASPTWGEYFHVRKARHFN